MNFKHRKAPRAVLFFSLIYTLIIVAGCAPAQAAPTPSEKTSQLPSATQTALIPTSTSAPISTVTSAPTLTPSMTPSLVPSPTAQASFNLAKVIQIRNQVGGVMVTISLPNLREVYNVILAGIDYTCNLNEKYPDMLFCWGLAAPPFNKEVNLTFLNPASGAVVVEVKTFLAEANFPPAGIVTDNSTSCANKGENQTCEVECRIDEDGDPCIVASCYDACGQTLSIQTCSSNLTDISFCTADETEAIKKRYNIP